MYADENAFKGCTNLSEVILPVSVTTIGAGAFNGCNSLTSLRKVTVFDGNVSYGSFDACKNLTSIILPETKATLKFE